MTKEEIPRSLMLTVPPDRFEVVEDEPVVEDEEDEDEPTATISITETESRILATLLFHATTDDYPELTADVAESLLGKLRYAVFR
jgi:hypothetical protein